MKTIRIVCSFIYLCDYVLQYQQLNIKWERKYHCCTSFPEIQLPGNLFIIEMDYCFMEAKSQRLNKHTIYIEKDKILNHLGKY